MEEKETAVFFFKSSMGQQILNGIFKIPEDSALPGTDIIVPHVVHGDQAFRLHKHILRPFSQKSARGDNSKTVFNYRLSRARRVTEKCFWVTKSNIQSILSANQY